MKRSSVGMRLTIFFLLSAMRTFAQDYWYQDNFWGNNGTGDRQFNSPQGIAVDTNGLVYVADTSNHRIQVFQSDGTFVRKWGSSGTGDSQFSSPSSISVGPTGLVFVSDTGNHRIQIFQSDGTFVRKWGSSGTASSQFNSPNGIAVDTNGIVYVVDSNNHRIQVFQSDGTFVRKWGSNGSGDGQFNNPFGIAVSGNGSIVVTDRSNARIQVFQSDGTFVRKWGSSGRGTGQFQDIFGVAVGKNNLIYSTDAYYYYIWAGSIYHSRIQVFDSNGVYLWSWGSWGSGVGQFQYAYNLAIGTNGFPYVADTSNHRIQVIRGGYRTPSIGVPFATVMTVTQRVGTAYADIDYMIWDDDSPTVKVGALGWANGTISLDTIVRLSTLLESTSNNLGENITVKVPHRITWDAGADWKVSSGNIKFDILANDGRPMIDFHFITVPANGADAELEIERFPMKESDFQNCWYWLIATRDPAIDFRTNKVYGVSGAYENRLLAQSSGTTDDGRAFLCERLNVRLATVAEVSRARAGSTATTNSWGVLYYATDRRSTRNEIGFDTGYVQGAGAWYAVPLTLIFNPASATKMRGSSFSTTASVISIPLGCWVNRLAWDMNDDGINDIFWNRIDTNSDGLINENDAAPNYSLTLTWAQMAAYPDLQSVGLHGIKLSVTDNLDVIKSGYFWLRISP